jgi:hypothetical protein
LKKEAPIKKGTFFTSYTNSKEKPSAAQRLAFLFVLPAGWLGSEQEKERGAVAVFPGKTIESF